MSLAADSFGDQERMMCGIHRSNGQGKKKTSDWSVEVTGSSERTEIAE